MVTKLKIQSKPQKPQRTQKNLQTNYRNINIFYTNWMQKVKIISNWLLISQNVAFFMHVLNFISFPI